MKTTQSSDLNTSSNEGLSYEDYHRHTLINLRDKGTTCDHDKLMVGQIINILESLEDKEEEPKYFTVSDIRGIRDVVMEGDNWGEIDPILERIEKLLQGERAKRLGVPVESLVYSDRIYEELGSGYTPPEIKDKPTVDEFVELVKEIDSDNKDDSPRYCIIPPNLLPLFTAPVEDDSDNKDEYVMSFLTLKGSIEATLSSWAKYVAQDEDGDWWEYSEEPDPLSEPDQWKSPPKALYSFLIEGVPPEDWTQELYEVTRDE